MRPSQPPPRRAGLDSHDLAQALRRRPERRLPRALPRGPRKLLRRRARRSPRTGLPPPTARSGPLLLRFGKARRSASDSLPGFCTRRDLFCSGIEQKPDSGSGTFADSGRARTPVDGGFRAQTAPRSGRDNTDAPRGPTMMDRPVPDSPRATPHSRLKSARVGPQGRARHRDTAIRNPGAPRISTSRLDGASVPGRHAEQARKAAGWQSGDKRARLRAQRPEALL